MPSLGDLDTISAQAMWPKRSTPIRNANKTEYAAAVDAKHAMPPSTVSIGVQTDDLPEANSLDIVMLSKLMAEHQETKEKFYRYEEQMKDIEVRMKCFDEHPRITQLRQTNAALNSNMHNMTQDYQSTRNLLENKYNLLSADYAVLEAKHTKAMAELESLRLKVKDMTLTKVMAPNQTDFLSLAQPVQRLTMTSKNMHTVLQCVVGYEHTQLKTAMFDRMVQSFWTVLALDHVVEMQRRQYELDYGIDLSAANDAATYDLPSYEMAIYLNNLVREDLAAQTLQQDRKIIQTAITTANNCELKKTTIYQIFGHSFQNQGLFTYSYLREIAHRNNIPLPEAIASYTGPDTDFYV